MINLLGKLRLCGARGASLMMRKTDTPGTPCFNLTDMSSRSEAEETDSATLNDVRLMNQCLSVA